MPLTYEFEVATESAPSALLEAALAVLRVEARDGSAARAHGMRICALELDDEDGEATAEVHGIRPTAALSFDLVDPGDDTHEAMGRAVAAVLDAVAGDAVLTFQGEDAIIRRLAGRVEVLDPSSVGIVDGFRRARAAV